MRINLVITQRVLEAAVDYYYLLERGYDRSRALNVVTGRWQIDSLSRMMLYRCVFNSGEALRRRGKLWRLEMHERIAVDGFNVLSTIQAALLGDTLIESMDGWVRDLSATFRKVRVSPPLITSLFLLYGYLARLAPNELILAFDKQVSRSGELASLARRFMPVYSLKGTAVTCSKTDKFLLSLAETYVIASSDSLVIDSAIRVADLGGLISRMVARERIINIVTILKPRISHVSRIIAEGASKIDEKDGATGEGARGCEGSHRVTR